MGHPARSLIRYTRLFGALQQDGNRAFARIGHEAYQAGRAGVQVDAVRLHEKRIASGHVERFDAGVTADNETPSFSLPVEAPRGTRRQLEPFNREVRTGNEKRPFVSEPDRVSLDVGGPSVRGRDSILDVKGTLPTVIEKTKRGVAALLDFCDHEPRANRVDRASGHENGIPA
jgi:hypothetical protein